jgi:hypothetical protein
MMRSRWRSLASLTACGLLVLVAAAAGASRMAQGTDAAARTGHARSLMRTWNVTLSPAPNDVALAEIVFRRGSRHEAISKRTVGVRATAPFGDDYMATAAPVSRTTGELQVLVVAVNRPSPLADPVNVHLRLTVPRVFGTPVVWKLANPFARRAAGLTPALCNLPLHGPTLSGSALLPLRSQGAALAGFGPASAVAQAYDVACGLPYEGSFELAVAGSTPSPSPTPPPPVCAPCDPPPGYVCPMVQPSVCVAPVSSAAKRAAAGAH